MSLEEALKNAKGAPYRKPIIAVVCGVSDPITYKKESGEEKQLVTIGLADHSTIVKCLLYDISKLKDMKEGNTVLILNSITKQLHKKL
ncbi:hypothetical protein FSP39_004350 [Pinctada imbricata]|uniref:Uncharacterized protein n=1 Tax=Pinctada imbricata TaxID=66713 RepID=A0AA88YUN7_PINIB|nr:hypothetical protein FSP39_004350 [Pinctada imbricata]